MSVLSRLRLLARPLLRRREAPIARRPYGSAAALEVDYDYYDEDEFERVRGDRSRATAIADSEGWVPGRGVQWVVLGDPGAKKTVYAERLSKLLDVPHISMGSLVRQELNPRSSIYQQIASSINEGKPVLEEIIFSLLSKRLEEGYSKGESGFILEGIPRTRNQAVILDQVADIDMVINFKTSEEGLMRKNNMGSGNFSGFHEYSTIRSSCGSNSNLQPQDIDPKCISATTEFTWKEMTSLEQRKPLEDYYRGQRKLVDFQVTGAPGETWKGLLEALHLQHINNAFNSSTHKLTT